MIFSALIYEGILSILILVFYFVVEPRIPKEKGFFTTRNILTMIFCLPFAEFILGFILQSSSCLKGNNFCVGIPDIFKHSLSYDIFYLRVNDTTNGAHWIDYMFLPILFFLTYYLTKDAFFSALNSGFMVFFHEVVWFVFYWLRYYNSYQFEGWYNDIAFFILVCSIGFVGLKKYRHYYGQFFLWFSFCTYVLFLDLWTYLNNFQVTVINNTQLGNSNQFLMTQWYYDFWTNAWEVLSWVLVFGLFVLNICVLTRWYKQSVKL